MILLCSNAQNLYWLGRYLMRIDFFCSRIPFTDDQAAIDYAHAFCLPAFDAASLNELALDLQQPYSFTYQFSLARDNIQELRAVLPAHCYAELNLMIKNAGLAFNHICDVVQECNDMIEAEAEQDVFLFYALGQKIEHLDSMLRLKLSTTAVIDDIDRIVNALAAYGWIALEEVWTEFKHSPDADHFYDFNDQVQHMFEIAA